MASSNKMTPAYWRDMIITPYHNRSIPNNQKLFMLETGEEPDCVIKCKAKTWKAHTRVLWISSLQIDDYYTAHTITISRLFDDVEVDWLLSYLYTGRINFQQATQMTPTKCLAETCVRIEQIATFYRVTELAEAAQSALRNWAFWKRLQISEPDQYGHPDDLAISIKAAVKAVWMRKRKSLSSDDLVVMCCHFSRHLRRDNAIFELREEVSGFAAIYDQVVACCEPLAG